jgi:hypothetical protein
MEIPEPDIAHPRPAQGGANPDDQQATYDESCDCEVKGEKKISEHP